MQNFSRAFQHLFIYVILISGHKVITIISFKDDFDPNSPTVASFKNRCSEFPYFQTHCSEFQPHYSESPCMCKGSSTQEDSLQRGTCRSEFPPFQTSCSEFQPRCNEFPYFGNSEPSFIRISLQNLKFSTIAFDSIKTLAYEHITSVSPLFSSHFLHNSSPMFSQNPHLPSHFHSR